MASTGGWLKTQVVWRAVEKELKLEDVKQVWHLDQVDTILLP